MVTIQHPAQFFSGGLTDVSCASSTECLATGFYFTSVQGNSFSLTELWNGQRWRILNPRSIFFVLSGFLITSLLIGEWDRRGGSISCRRPPVSASATVTLPRKKLS
ncbi:MAG TPA: hypothetical protein VF983_06260 [Streptosporangiaceae bacterium]